VPSGALSLSRALSRAHALSLAELDSKQRNHSEHCVGTQPA